MSDQPKDSFSLLCLPGGLSAVEIGLYQHTGCLLVAFDVVSERRVMEGLQLPDNSIDHLLAEDTPLFEDSALLLQTVGRSRTAVRELCKVGKDFLILLVMDVDINICSLCNF